MVGRKLTLGRLVRRVALGVTSLTLAASVMFGATPAPADPAPVADASIGSENPAVANGVAEAVNEELASLKLSVTPDSQALNGGADVPTNCPAGMENGFEKDFAVVWPAPSIGDMQGGIGRIRMPAQNLNHFTAATGPAIVRAMNFRLSWSRRSA